MVPGALDSNSGRCTNIIPCDMLAPSLMSCSPPPRTACSLVDKLPSRAGDFSGLHLVQQELPYQSLLLRYCLDQSRLIAEHYQRSLSSRASVSGTEFDTCQRSPATPSKKAAHEARPSSCVRYFAKSLVRSTAWSAAIRSSRALPLT
jgi:hypothetical protein